MADNSGCKIFIGNLDEKVPEKVLYEILIQVGRVDDLYIPRDRHTKRSKGYAFAVYETKEVADYAIRLFSGLVTLNNKKLKFAIHEQDKLAQNGAQMKQASEQDSCSWSKKPTPQQLPGADRHQNLWLNVSSHDPWTPSTYLNGAVPSMMIPHSMQYAQVPQNLMSPSNGSKPGSWNGYGYNAFGMHPNTGYGSRSFVGHVGTYATHRTY